MSLILILALAFTICLGIEAFAPDAIAVRIAKICKFVVGLVFTVTLFQ